MATINFTNLSRRSLRQQLCHGNHQHVQPAEGRGRVLRRQRPATRLWLRRGRLIEAATATTPCTGTLAGTTLFGGNRPRQAQRGDRQRFWTGRDFQLRCADRQYRRRQDLADGDKVNAGDGNDQVYRLHVWRPAVDVTLGLGNDTLQLELHDHDCADYNQGRIDVHDFKAADKLVFDYAHDDCAFFGPRAGARPPGCEQ